MKKKKEYSLKIILFVVYIIFNQGVTIFGCPTYISYSDDNGSPFFEEQDIEVESNTQSEQIASASITDDTPEDK